MLIENILGFAPDGANNKLTWTLNRIDRHGIENLRFGNVKVSVICKKRNSVVSPAVVNIHCDKPFELTIVYSFEKHQTFKLEAGKHQLTVNQ